MRKASISINPQLLPQAFLSYYCSSKPAMYLITQRGSSDHQTGRFWSLLPRSLPISVLSPASHGRVAASGGEFRSSRRQPLRRVRGKNAASPPPAPRAHKMSEIKGGRGRSISRRHRRRAAVTDGRVTGLLRRRRRRPR